MQNGRRLGILTLVEVSQPAFFCHFAPSELFAEFAPLFAAEREAVRTKDSQTWNQRFRQIGDLGLSLEPIGQSEPMAFHVFYIDGERAWFRPRFSSSTGI